MNNQLVKDEWNAWKIMCDYLKEEGLDINQCDNVCKSIQTWGWKFHFLQKVKEEEALTRLPDHYSLNGEKKW